MTNLSPLANWRYDFPASIVVLLVALPLCLGIAMASGAPLFSGLIAGIVGGIVIGCLSKSPLSISGPAAGLTVIVLSAIQELPSFEAFLLAVFLAGVLQVLLGVLKAGVLGDFIPSTVIKGMLAAIGLILILKQLPYAVGYNADYEGSESFWQADGHNTLSALWHMMFQHLSAGAVLISSISLAFLFWWDKRQMQFENWLRYIPGPLMVVLFGVTANLLFTAYSPELALAAEYLVSVPVSNSPSDFLGHFNSPDFSLIENKTVWITAITLAIVASVESLLSIEAVDKLDPFKRITPTNRELMAQGAGNMVSGLIGGLPVTSVIVRSSANVTSGGRTQMSSILHGVMLLLCVIAIPHLLNYIPLAALAAILIAVGYKLTKPRIFFQKYEKGAAYFVPFVVTIVAILMTDLLIGIGIGVAVGMVFVIMQNCRSVILFVSDGSNYLIRMKKDMFFVHKYELKQTLNKIPQGSSVLIDMSRAGFIDLDNIDLLNDFIASAPMKDIRVTLKHSTDPKITNDIKEPENAAA